MSNPVWVDLLIELLTPYLEVIIPLIGLTAILIPWTSPITLSCVLVSLLTALEIVVFATSTLFVFTSSALFVVCSIIFKSTSLFFSSCIN